MWSFLIAPGFWVIIRKYFSLPTHLCPCLVLVWFRFHTLNSLLHLESFWYIVWDMDPISCVFFFFKWLSSCPNNIIKMPVFSPNKLGCHPYHILFFHIYLSLFLGFLFCFIGLSVSSCASTTLINHRSFSVCIISGRVTPPYFLKVFPAILLIFPQ